jgi:hypothetical protein
MLIAQGSKRNVGLQNYKNESCPHDFHFHNFVDVSLGQNFECFVSNKVTKQNTKVMTETLFLSRAKRTSFAVLAWGTASKLRHFCKGSNTGRESASRSLQREVL